MADNVHVYGFRFHKSGGGSGRPTPEEWPIASGFSPTVSAQTVNVNIGDPVQITTDGTMILASATGTDPAILYGVVAGFSNVKLGPENLGKPTSKYIAGTTYSGLANQTRVLVLPFGANYWEIDCDDAVTATTRDAYQALVGENADFAFSRDATDANNPKANPLLDISSHTVVDPGAGGTATSNFRIVGISNTLANQDFSGNFVKLIVKVNETGEAPYNANSAI